LVASALDRADRLLILRGSHRCVPDTRNPWSSEERERMIRDALRADRQRWLEVIPIRDHLSSDNLWLAEVHQKVLAVTDEEDRLLLVGHGNDRSSDYLGLFPQWDFQDMPLKSAIRPAASRPCSRTARYRAAAASRTCCARATATWMPTGKVGRRKPPRLR
jgi:bifunctional NMN adenylyltransferase/nudix hydrolase